MIVGSSVVIESGSLATISPLSPAQVSIQVCSCTACHGCEPLGLDVCSIWWWQEVFVGKFEESSLCEGDGVELELEPNLDGFVGLARSGGADALTAILDRQGHLM